MAVERVAFITIGQSPRNDILDEMRPWWRKEIAIEQYGALDGLPPSAIRSLEPRAGEARLVSRLRDGSTNEPSSCSNGVGIGLSFP